MIALVLIPVALVALVVLSILGLAGIGPISDERRAGRSGALGAVGPLLGLLVGGGLLALAAVGTLLLVGFGESSDGDRRAGDRDGAVVGATTPPTTPPTPTPPTPTTTARARTPVVGPEVRVEAHDGEAFPTSYDVADRLEPHTVVRMHVLGFEPFARALAEQCARTVARWCGNQIPVQFDADGEARFQYLISTEFLDDRPVPGDCRADTAPCSIAVRAIEGDARGEIQTIFVDALPPPGRIEVTPATGLSLEGERVQVEVHDYPPDTEVTAMLCAAPDAVGTRCGAPGPTVTILVGPDGEGRADLLVTPGPVGTDQVQCSRGDDCGVSVASADVFARAPVVSITFAAPPGARYDPMRLALGLAVAVLLLAGAAVLLLRTDWAPVGEAAAPEIDDAEYADLDAIIAALPPEEDELVVSR